MAIAALQNLGTVLRHTNDELRRIATINEDERESIAPVKEKGAAMVDVLNTLGAGTPPVPDNAPVVPTRAFLNQAQNVLLDAVTRLDPMIAANPLPAQLANIQALKDRVLALDAVVAVAQGRDDDDNT